MSGVASILAIGREDCAIRLKRVLLTDATVQLERPDRVVLDMECRRRGRGRADFQQSEAPTMATPAMVTAVFRNIFLPCPGSLQPMVHRLAQGAASARCNGNNPQHPAAAGTHMTSPEAARARSPTITSACTASPSRCASGLLRTGGPLQIRSAPVLYASSRRRQLSTLGSIAAHPLLRNSQVMGMHEWTKNRSTPR
jgi:hypothetical protein